MRKICVYMYIYHSINTSIHYSIHTALWLFSCGHFSISGHMEGHMGWRYFMWMQL